MQWSSFVSLALIASKVHGASAFATAPMLRFACSQLVVERLDPKSWLEGIVGGNAFNATMDPKNDISSIATCTSCTFSEDFSNYWTAVLYFRARNGTFKRVPQIGNQFLEQAIGGVTVYYIPPYDGKTNVTAFKQGFRMIVGDPMVRTNLTATSPEARSMSYRCFEKNWGEIDTYPGGGNDTRNLPNYPCPGGIRVNNFFPTCWDGKNLDSPDHKSHVSYPSNGTFESGGPCPSTHPVKIPQVMYETVWNTTEFNDPSLWPTDGSQPFVFSMGDPTGWGHHGDYIFGWKGDALQRAMDNFCHQDCPVLKTQSYEIANKCTKAPVVKEPIDGWLDNLPGNEPVTFAIFRVEKGNSATSNMRFEYIVLLALSACGAIAAPTSPVENVLEISINTGTATEYSPGGNVGTCGKSYPNSALVVALGRTYITGASSADCGRKVTITNGSKVVIATVADLCPQCDSSNIDLSPGAWTALTGKGSTAGRISVTWSVVPNALYKNSNNEGPGDLCKASAELEWGIFKKVFATPSITI
ncbi:hypothetical protein G7Y89_g5802 [Cudoniella acicularis]|uniref:DUF1996 domain-containing protein n=1 Tax=Cudoniella acicularis TaxID=354080 RepID=A0A8H4RN77_9HELO|nr:hypothetical protein G7Y89_g5802 [Cudoniella acicularis]